MDESNSKSHTTSVVIAIVGLLGSLGAAWITAGAKFDRDLEKKTAEISSLSNRIESLDEKLKAGTDLNEKLDKLTARVQTMEGIAEVETRDGLGVASKGMKACMIVVPGRWIDVISLPTNATAQQCEVLSGFESSGNTKVYRLGCIFGDRFVWAPEGGAPPSPNCGW